MVSGDKLDAGIASKRQRKPHEFLHGDTKDIPFDVDEEDEVAPPYKKVRLDEIEEPDNTDDTDYKAEPEPQTKTSSNRPRRALSSAQTGMDREDLRKELLRSLITSDDFRRQIGEIKSKRTVDRKELDKEKKQRIAYKRKIKELEAEVEALEDKLERRKMRYSAKIDEQRQDFEDARRDLSTKIESQNYSMLPDNVVRDKFTRMLSKCREWVKLWHSRDPSAEWSSELVNILHMIVGSIDLSAKERLSQQIQDKGANGRKLVAYASLTRSVLLNFFRDPFVLFEATDSDASFHLQLKRIYEKIVKDDKATAFSWRAETVRLLRAQINSDIARSADGNDDLANARLRAYCSREALVWLDTPGGPLRDVSEDEAEQRYQQLTNIINDGAWLALELWSRKGDIRLLGERIICKHPFKNRSELYVPHRSMLLDEDDDSLNGQAIQAVLTPGVQLLGHGGGGSLEGSKILSKAIVLIIRDPTEDCSGRYADGEKVEQSHMMVEGLCKQKPKIEVRVPPVGKSVDKKSDNHAGKATLQQIKEETKRQKNPSPKTSKYNPISDTVMIEESEDETVVKKEPKD